MQDNQYSFVGRFKEGFSPAELREYRRNSKGREYRLLDMFRSGGYAEASMDETAVARGRERLKRVLRKTDDEIDEPVIPVSNDAGIAKYTCVDNGESSWASIRFRVDRVESGEVGNNVFGTKEGQKLVTGIFMGVTDALERVGLGPLSERVEMESFSATYYSHVADEQGSDTGELVGHTYAYVGISLEDFPSVAIPRVLLIIENEVAPARRFHELDSVAVESRISSIWDEAVEKLGDGPGV